MLSQPSSCQPFQSTRPVWGATLVVGCLVGAGMISIHAPRVGRDKIRVVKRCAVAISIHAPRVGRDDPFPVWCRGKRISIHAPRVGRDVYPLPPLPRGCRFQSTRPVWGATELTAADVQTL